MGHIAQPARVAPARGAGTVANAAYHRGFAGSRFCGLAHRMTGSAGGSVQPMHAKYYTRFILKAGEASCADEYTGVVELSQPANTVLDPQEIEAILARNFKVEANAVELLNWSRVH